MENEIDEFKNKYDTDMLTLVDQTKKFEQLHEAERTRMEEVLFACFFFVFVCLSLHNSEIL